MLSAKGNDGEDLQVWYRDDLPDYISNCGYQLKSECIVAASPEEVQEWYDAWSQEDYANSSADAVPAEKKKLREQMRTGNSANMSNVIFSCTEQRSGDRTMYTLEHRLAPLPWPLSPRESIHIIKSMTRPGRGFAVVGRRWDDRRLPEAKPGIVRSGYGFQALVASTVIGGNGDEQQHSKVTWLNTLDPGPYIPAMVFRRMMLALCFVPEEGRKHFATRLKSTREQAEN